MKKQFFWTWAFIISGIVVLVGASSWYLKYPNPSEYFAYLGGSIFLFVFAGFVSAVKKLSYSQKELEEKVKELQRWATEQEKDKEYNEYVKKEKVEDKQVKEESHEQVKQQQD